ncbi:MAG: hypothetical protein H8D23_37615 [Candidatus Brocadiales bacterium]|nr:hypothetical protein [Candidatus Brocadiales bacterium]
MGYRFEPTGLKIAPKTQKRFLERIARLYEQGAVQPASGNTSGTGADGRRQAEVR